MQPPIMTMRASCARQSSPTRPARGFSTASTPGIRRRR